MKPHYLIIATTTVFLLACSGGSELDKKQKELSKLKAEQTTINGKIEKLEEEIAVLAPAQQHETKVTPVKTTSVSPQTFNHFIEVQGTVDSDQNILVTPKTGGTITRVFVNEGDQVRQGQVMAEIDDAVLRQNAEEIKTNLSLLTTIYEKQKALWDQKIGSEVQYLQAKNNKESQERRLSTLNSQLAQTKITSPISGVVDDVRIKQGEAAAPGVGVIRVVNLSGIKVKANVADSYIDAVKKGDAVTIRIPDINKQFQGKVSFVGQVVNTTSRTFPIEVSLPNEGKQLKPNMLAVIDINDQSKPNAIVIQQNYVQKSESGDVVFVATKEGNRQVAKAKKVKTGLAYKGTIEVLEGLKAGDQVIAEGYQDLVDGQSISLPANASQQQSMR